MMEYKGYIGNVGFDAEAGVFHGEVINTRDVITFQGKSVQELKKAFRDSVNDYLSFCHDRGETPDKPFTGRFVTRISPDLHRLISTAAVVSGKSMNAFVTEQLQAAVQHVGAVKQVPEKKRFVKKSGGRSVNVKNAGRRATPAK